MSQPKLKLATRLEELESQHQTRNQISQNLRQPSAERFPAPASRLPREHHHVSQILYQKDAYKGYPVWKREIVQHVYLPLFRAFHKWLDLFPPTRMEPDGTYSWLVHQGCFLTREEADRDAARYPHGYVVPNMPLGQSLTESVPEKSAIYFAKGGTPASKPRAPVDWACIQEEVNLLEELSRNAKRITIQ